MSIELLGEARLEIFMNVGRTVLASVSGVTLTGCVLELGLGLAPVGGSAGAGGATATGAGAGAGSGGGALNGGALVLTGEGGGDKPAAGGIANTTVASAPSSSSSSSSASTCCSPTSSVPSLSSHNESPPTSSLPPCWTLRIESSAHCGGPSSTSDSGIPPEARCIEMLVVESGSLVGTMCCVRRARNGLGILPPPGRVRVRAAAVGVEIVCPVSCVARVRFLDAICSRRASR